MRHGSRRSGVTVGLSVLAVLVLNPSGASACGLGPYRKQLAVQAFSAHAPEASAAIEKLRRFGQEGLDALFDEYTAQVKKRGPSSPMHWLLLTQPGKELKRLRNVLDAVARQKDSHASRLYWYTDMAQAKRAAGQTGKPILSLRLLGNLDEEYSCANSRFFRTVLYANVEVSRVLRERFILHWKSVRPVPRITVNFGDGRKIVRTITGNSIHYVLDAKGRTVDAIPGLYGPKAFLQVLQRVEAVAVKMAGISGQSRKLQLRKHHLRWLSAATARWTADLKKLGMPASLEKIENPMAQGGGQSAAPSAYAASEVAVGKGVVELPVLIAGFPDRERLRKSTTEEVWPRIAALHADESRLDAGSRRLMGEKTTRTDARVAARRALSKTLIEDPLLRVIRNFERSIAEDTVRNEYLLHARIHQWFAQGRGDTDADALNEKVYAELFLTPRSDPWLGLVPPDTYAALPGEGIIHADPVRKESRKGQE